MGLNIIMMTSSNGHIFRVTWPFVQGVHRSPVNSPHKGQWRGALIFSWYDLRLNKRWWFGTPLRSLWRHCNDYPMTWVYAGVDMWVCVRLCQRVCSGCLTGPHGRAVFLLNVFFLTCINIFDKKWTNKSRCNYLYTPFTCDIIHLLARKMFKNMSNRSSC